MKVVKSEKIIKEEVIKYEAFDGIMFESEEECKKYENTAYAVVKKEYLKYQINKITEYDYYAHNAGCDDYHIAILDVKDDHALEAINRYIEMNGSHLIVSRDYIGKTIAMSLGFTYGKYEYDSVGYIYGTIDEILDYRRKTLEDIFNPVEDDETEVSK